MARKLKYDGEKHFRLWMKSGLSSDKYAAQNGLPAASFKTYAYTRRRKEAATPNFVEVGGKSKIVITWRGVSFEVDRSDLPSVVQTIAEASK